ncbi:hypothetical protein KJ877_08830 [bacterium]|nr:hypothetical protein [bacterium]MBU1990801.1 hypothetical protein [bacterium]
MQTGLNALYTIGSNYSIRLNEKELLVYEDDTTGESKKSQQTQKNDEREKAKEKSKTSSQSELSQDEERLLKELQSRDSQVRAHEAAHKSGGASTGAASYTYQKGPDGRMYAIGGEVSVSMKSGSTPQETISNAQAVIASAMAPANPSPQDYAVASSARVMMMKAQQQARKELQDEMSGKEIYKNEVDKNSNEMSKKEDASIKGSSGVDIPA